MIIACSQCFITLSQVLAVCSACVAPLMLNFTKIFRKNLKKPLDINDKCITLEKQTTI